MCPPPLFCRLNQDLQDLQDEASVGQVRQLLPLRERVLPNYRHVYRADSPVLAYPPR